MFTVLIERPLSIKKLDDGNILEEASLGSKIFKTMGFLWFPIVS